MYTGKVKRDKGYVAFTFDEQRQVEDLEPVLDAMGFTLVDLKMKSMHGTLQIHLVVHKGEGISLDDCADIYKTLYPRLELSLDCEDIQLEVSSPGIGRVFKDKREYGIFKNMPVALLMDNESEWRKGFIKEVREENIEFEEGKELYTVSFDTIRKAKLI